MPPQDRVCRWRSVPRWIACLLLAAPVRAGPDSSAHWAWQPLRPPALPAVRDASAVRNDVDRFVQAGLEWEGLAAAPPADRRVWLRRVTYNLTGLPPTMEEVEAFLRDDTPDANARAVDRLLASPHYGEHWGRHWLDVVRYADTAGENSDYPLPHIWRYRNWVFDAFNRDVPFDTFTRLQIAGDLLAAGGSDQARREGVVPTGYLSLARRFGHDSDKEMHLTREDAIDNLGQAFLGLTLGCARCHDHKHDPVPMRDYYALYGIFASTRLSFAGCEAKQRPRDLVPLLSETETEALLRPWRDQRAGFDTRIREMESEAKRLRDLWASGDNRRTLAGGAVGEGGSVELSAAKKSDLSRLAVRKGEVLLLSVSPRANHGADSTRVEWSITEGGAVPRRWDVADLIDSLLSANPHAGSTNAPSAWYFLDLLDGPSLLAERLEAAGKRGEVKAWRNGDTPSVFVNTAAVPVSVWTELQARSFHVHPGPKGPVGVAWVCPEDGIVSVAGRISDAHPSGGDGVEFAVEHLADPEAGARLARLLTAGAEIAEVRRRRDTESGPEPRPPLAFAAAEGSPAHARLQERGDPEALGEEVPRGWLTVLGGGRVPADAGSGRRELAGWVAGSPLSTRVFVNRVWQGHFGRGLVRTPNDFGTHGEAPTHPELLEWLACWFEAHGRSPKALHRLLLDSAAARRSSQADPAILARDPDNRLLARFARRRLSAEELRDTLLVAAGNLDRSPGEAHPFPPADKWGYTQHAPFNAVYDNNRRTAYQMVQRQRRHPFLALFDGADPNATTGTRQVTTAPTQALFFFNDPFFHEQAARLAAPLGALPDDAARVRALFHTVLQQDPNPEDASWANDFLHDYPGTPAARHTALARVLLAGNELLHVD